MEDKIYSEIEQKKAAYALNMCTVSISQILDYNDIYVLEQEYDAILNNLNLEIIPKDDALLNILQEILNVISFFRVQKIRRDQNDNEYQQRIKNAIWHAIPSFNMFIAPSTISNSGTMIGQATKGLLNTNVAMLAVNLATQIGTGYMNYRREKANANLEKEKAEIELEIAAIEQLHALQRELFTTAWMLADRYGYPDEWRLTEKQIEQYNQILMDTDEYRKYARLEAIQDKFQAYPAFWYYFAHTALYIATTFNDPKTREEYKQKACKHFEQYYAINQFNLLREDQLTATANLEYADLLFLNPNPNYKKINEIVADAEKKAGNANDILQLCAVAYLRVGNRSAAADLLKILVNEGYNASTNAQLLSRLYVQQYVSAQDEASQTYALSNYRILGRQINSCHLFPMPENRESAQAESLENQFISTQKMLLKKMYRNSINAFAKQNAIDFNAVLPAPYHVTEPKEEYWGQTSKAREKRIHDAKVALTGNHAENYIVRLRECGFRYGYIDVLNNTVSGMEELHCFRRLSKHDNLIAFLAKKLKNSKVELWNQQSKMDDGSFNFDDYLSLVNTYSYKYFTAEFFDKIKEYITSAINAETELDKIEDLYSDLETFCEAHNLPSPNEYIQTFKELSMDVGIPHDSTFFEYDLLCDSTGKFEYTPELRDKMQTAIQSNISNIIADPEKVHVYLRGSQQFDSFLKNECLKLQDVSIYEVRQRAIAIIDDVTKEDEDLILSVDGIRLVRHNRIRESVEFSDTAYVKSGNSGKLKLGFIDDFSNKNVKHDVLKAIIDSMDELLSMAQAR